MTDSPEQVSQILRNIRGLPYGAARTAAAVDIARRIETEGPQEKLPEALLDLVEAYCFGGEREKAFVPFAHALRLWDTTPELFDEADKHNLFWEYKWVGVDLAGYPDITADQARAFLTTMAQHFDVAGYGRRAIANLEFHWAWFTGDPGMEAARVAWLGMPLDDMDDCQACLVGQQTDYFLSTGQFEQAIAIGETQRHQCNREPAVTQNALALAYLETGNAEKALSYHRKAKANGDPTADDDTAERGQQFELLARGGQIDVALRELRSDYSEWLTGSPTPLHRMRFLPSLLAGLSANLDQPDRPTGLEAPLATVGALHQWALAEATALAARFDARDGNDYYARAVDKALAARMAPVHLDLDARTSGMTAADVIARAAAARGKSDYGAIPFPGEGEDIPAGTPPETLADKAEQARMSHDEAAAAVQYADAAREAVEAGRLAEAGWAWAESAHCLADLGDDATANERYGVAVPLLVAGEAAEELITQVLLAWSPVAARLQRTAPVIAALTAAIGRLDAAVPGDEAPELAQQRRRERARLQASLQDGLARVVASTPVSQQAPGQDTAEAIRLALAAGEAYGGLEAVSDAAYAFWLAGDLQRAAGLTDDALWSYESAVEGFELAQLKKPRAEVAGPFIELLRATGQFAKADAIIASLT